MSRRKFVAGNWKMNTTAKSAVELAKALVARIGQCSTGVSPVTENHPKERSLDTGETPVLRGELDMDMAVCPPFPYLLGVRDALAGSKIALGAQDVFYENNGAFTGEVSAAMLKDAGCTFVICGHSERRHVIGESDQIVNRKVLKVLAEGLRPIFCVGELLAERQAGHTLDVVSRQVRLGLEGVSAADAARVVLAYEPVWAIGTGVVATPQQAQEVHAMIRKLLGELYGPVLAGRLQIQYGGSVKASNARELLSCPDIDGALVGGASLKAEEFEGIVRAGL